MHIPEVGLPPLRSRVHTLVIIIYLLFSKRPIVFWIQLLRREDLLFHEIVNP